MKEVICEVDKNLIDIINNSKLDISYETKKYRLKEKIKLLVVQIGYIAACTCMNIDSLIIILSYIMAGVSADMVLSGNSKKYGEMLEKKQNSANYDLKKIVSALSKNNININLSDEERNSILFKLGLKNNNTEVNDIGLIDDKNRINVLRQIRKFENNKLSLCKYNLYTSEEYKNLDEYNTVNSLVLKKIKNFNNINDKL